MNEKVLDLENKVQKSIKKEKELNLSINKMKSLLSQKTKEFFLFEEKVTKLELKLETYLFWRNN